MKKEKKPCLEPFNMRGSMANAKDIYKELVQWGRSEDEDKSELRGSIYCIGYSTCDMPYMGWQGEELRKEVGKIDALVNAYKAFLSVLEDVIGVKGEWYDGDLNEYDEIRYQILDTKSGIKGE